MLTKGQEVFLILCVYSCYCCCCRHSGRYFEII